MRRTAFVPPAVALGLLALAGCGGSRKPEPTPCAAPRLLAYWAPGGTPQAGFQVPGLVAAGFPAQLGCAQAGVVGVRVFVGTPPLVAPCSGAGACLDQDTWRCDLASGGITVPLAAGPGTYSLQIDAFDAAGLAVSDAKYSSGPRSVTVAACGDTAVGLFPQGLPGVLGFDYQFTDTIECVAGSQIQWDLFRGPTQVEPGVGPGFGPCTRGGGVLLANGGADLPAGVYTLTRMAEVPPTGPSTHALCDYPLIVHAGNETVGGAFPFLNLPPATSPSCQ